MKSVLKPKSSITQSTLNQARALYYDFFAGFFLYELLDSRFDLFIAQIDILATSPLNESDLPYFRALKDALLSTNADAIKREYSQIFNIPFASKKADSALCDDEDSALDSTQDSTHFKDSTDSTQKAVHIFLYLSHYLEGCINGSSLLEAKEFVKKSKFRLNKEGFKESEEHFGFLLLFMRYSLQDSAVQDSNVNASEIFNALLRPMASVIAESLAKCENLYYYHLVGALLKSFIKVEEQICSD